jgi:hypothetical protein
MGLRKRSYSRFNNVQRKLALGQPNQWRCRAGARYLYICEEGLVHYCSQQRGFPGVPLERYSPEDVRREYYTRKSCAPRCTVSCVQQTAMLDNWRAPQTLDPHPHPQPAILPVVQQLVQLTGAQCED